MLKMLFSHVTDVISIFKMLFSHVKTGQKYAGSFHFLTNVIVSIVFFIIMTLSIVILFDI